MTKSLICSCKDRSKTKIIYDFGMMPYVNNYSNNQEKSDQCSLVLTVCESCKLVQLASMPDLNSLYSKYDHLSSASKANVKHLKAVADEINKKHTERKVLLEVGSNDGTFLRNLNNNFISYGIDPAKNVYKKMSNDMFTVHNLFFNTKNKLTIEGLIDGKVDILVGLNVFAHNDSYDDMFSVARYLLAVDGYAYIEVAYAKDTILSGNFDTIYHEHYCNYSLMSIISILKRNRLMVYDVVKLPTQGGSLGIWFKHFKPNMKVSENIDIILKEEENFGINDILMYEKLSELIDKKIKDIKNKFVEHSVNKKVLIVGVPARGVVTANICEFNLLNKAIAIDDTPEKQGYNIPGTNIPIKKPDEVNFENFDVACILAWTYKDELIKRIRGKGFKGEIFIPFPEGEYIN